MPLLAPPPPTTPAAQPRRGQVAAGGGGGAAGATHLESSPTHLEWISERHVTLADEAAPSGLRPGVRLLCVWLDGEPYSCQLLGGAAQGRVAVQFEDGLQFSAEEGALRQMLEEPLFPEVCCPLALPLPPPLPLPLPLPPTLTLTLTLTRCCSSTRSSHRAPGDGGWPPSHAPRAARRRCAARGY